MKTLTCRAQEAVAGWVVAELIFTEQARSDRRTTLRTRDVRVDPGLLAGLDVLDLEIAPISDDRDPLHAENLFCRFGGLCQQTHIHNLVRDLLLDDQLVLGVDRDLHVVAHRNMGMRRHRSAVGVGERDLALPRLVQLRQHVLVALTPLPNRGYLLSQVLDPRAACWALRGIALVEALKIVLELGVGGFDELGQGRPGEIAILVVDRLDPRAIHCEQLPAKQVQLATEEHKFSEHMAEGISVVAPKVSDRLEVWLQVPQQPDHLDIAMGLSLQPAARSHPVQIAVNVKLQQIDGRIARAACHLGLDVDKRRGRKIQPVDKNIDEAHRIVRANIIVNRLRQQ